MAVGQSFCVQIQYVKLHIYCIHISLGKGSVHLSCVRRQLYTSKRNTVSVLQNITVKFCLLTLPLLMLCLLDAARQLERCLTRSFQCPSSLFSLKGSGGGKSPCGFTYLERESNSSGFTWSKIFHFKISSNCRVGRESLRFLQSEHPSTSQLFPN